MAKCDFKGCKEKAVVTGKIYGKERGADAGTPDTFFDVKACFMHGHNPELWCVEPIEEENHETK